MAKRLAIFYTHYFLPFKICLKNFIYFYKNYLSHASLLKKCLTRDDLINIIKC